MPTLGGSRIAVVGPPGAGKTRLAGRLAEASGLPPVDLDDLYWGEGWERPAPAEWVRRHRAATERPEWIIAGNFQALVADRLDRATHLVVVDPGPVVCLARLLRRTASIYLGNTGALPSAVRANGRWSAGRGLGHIARLGLRYRRDLLPATRAAASAREVPVVMVGRTTSVDAVLRELRATTHR